MKYSKVLVVGAGFAGAVYAREIAEAGIKVSVIDRRPHVAGNAFDEITEEGVRKHTYGPHLFHTNNKTVVDWISQFAKFVPYEHSVQAELSSARFVPLPVNRETINEVFSVDLTTEADVRDFLATIAVPVASVNNAFEYLISNIGLELTELFFATYTRKMWAMELTDLSANVVKRIPLRYDNENRYFPNDSYQLLPEKGYTQLFETMLDHENIEVALNTSFAREMMGDFDFVFNSMAIDEFFGGDLGELPYRSIKFHHRKEPGDYARGTSSVINFTDDRRFTRETDWSRLPCARVSGSAKTITLEEPCNYTDNNFERYYPIKDSSGKHDQRYQMYRKRAEELPNLQFIGRCGTYQYLDMHQVINQSLKGAGEWLASAK